MTSPVIFWFRRDLRLADNPALVEALDRGDGRVAATFVVDERLAAGAGPVRRAYLHATLAALDESLGGALIVRRGETPPRNWRAWRARWGRRGWWPPATSRPRGVRAISASRANSGPRGYACASSIRPTWWRPGRSPPRPARRVGSSAPIVASGSVARAAPRGATWVDAASRGADEVTRVATTGRPAYFGDLSDEVPRFDPRVGERGAHATLGDFLARVDAYDEARDRPASAGTSRVSAHLHFGTLHPRQVLAAVNGSSRGAEVFRAEICWREFYADVVFHQPASTWRVLQPALAHLRVDRDARAVARFQTWARGETGYPLVDAGMRQLLAEGWMHNRVRMVCASFLVKHLHLDWRWGATWFMWRLVDADVASNQHGWQWTAGTGTDPAPFHRIFNPTRQAERYDPAGAYVRRYVDELRDVAAPQCLRPGGGEGLLAASGYVGAMVDLAHERTEALARVAEARALARAARGEEFA